MEALRQGDDAIAKLAASDPGVARLLMGRLWDADETIRRRAARGLASLAAARPGQGKELVRRLLWFLNDESTTNGVFGVPALGEIGYAAPELIEEYVPNFILFAIRDEGIREAVLKALARIAEASPHIVLPHVEPLLNLVDRQDPRWSEACRDLEPAS
jgi:HEAT repeat protein